MKLHEMPDKNEARLLEIFRSLNGHRRELMMDLMEAEYITNEREKQARKDAPQLKLVLD